MTISPESFRMACLRLAIAKPCTDAGKLKRARHYIHFVNMGESTDDMQIRLDCLQLAIEPDSPLGDNLNRAAAFASFVWPETGQELSEASVG